MIRHHLTEDQLLSYSAGTASEASAVLIASHLTLCPTCRAAADGLDVVHATLANQAPANIDVDALLARTLGQLDVPVASPQRRYDEDGILPWPLAQHLGNFSSLKWKHTFPGVHELEVGVETTGMPLRLFKLKAGSKVEDHRHKGLETSLVFTGGFTDDEGHFQRGDVTTRDDSAVHRQRVDPGEPCVVLVMADHPLVPSTLKGWAASKIRTF